MPGPAIELRRQAPDTLLVRLSGTWRLGGRPAPAADIGEELRREPTPKRVAFDAAELRDWDSTLLGFLRKLIGEASPWGIDVDPEGLPEGARRLMALAAAAPEGRRDEPDEASRGLVSRFGGRVLALYDSLLEATSFVGEVTLALLRFLVGRARCRRRDLMVALQEVGVEALPIVGLLSFLIGLILGYVGATQLERFGAEIYVADLVGVAMAREMAAVMTAIIMAGRTGAAFAAQLGTMQVNEEVDALTTSGLPPVEFLVLPRVLALSLMMPLLYVYSVLLGMVGGGLVGVLALDLNGLQYFEQTRGALALHHCAVGLLKSILFGVLVAAAGCLRGIRCGRSSAAVGEATTSAVVTAIVWIIVTDAILDVAFDVVGI